ncbi:hypothetical protein [uncultured Erythrobacter sp.]|uniref:hypothetical protein n=1 Tax=uncultured Erythrobacter sp. TaxID=263913 RepID=UPI00262ED9EF|nr:hypothetical protein [uncultured Erythrobacter sp.]
MSELLLPLAMLIATAGCAFIAYRIYRSPQNWHIDGEAKELRFHNWPSIGIFVCIGIMCTMTGYLVLL